MCARHPLFYHEAGGDRLLKPEHIVFTFFDGRYRRKLKVSDHVTVHQLSQIEDFCHQKILEIGKRKHEKRKKMR
jgi:hypothetical protein